jgi:hypothetical protein
MIGRAWEIGFGKVDRCGGDYVEEVVSYVALLSIWKECSADSAARTCMEVAAHVLIGRLMPRMRQS